MTMHGNAVSMIHGPASSSSIQQIAEAEFVGLTTTRAAMPTAIEPSEIDGTQPADLAQTQHEEQRPALQASLGEMLRRSLDGHGAKPRKGTSGLGPMFSKR